jgi:aspartyl/asparaginyl-tRNA synthetase
VTLVLDVDNVTLANGVFDRLAPGVSVSIRGVLVKSHGHKQALEFQVHTCTVLGDCDGLVKSAQVGGGHNQLTLGEIVISSAEKRSLS